MKYNLIFFTLFFYSCLGTTISDPKDNIPALKNFEKKFSKDSELMNVSNWKKGKRSFEITTIKNLKTSEAEKLIKEKRNAIRNLFDPKLSPYFQGVTKNVVCPKEYWPKITEKNDKEKTNIVFVMDANKRRVTGVCNDSSKYYKLIKVLLFCKNKENLHEIDYYIPKEDFNVDDLQSVSHISCF